VVYAVKNNIIQVQLPTLPASGTDPAA